ncbi:hypothetical protein Lfu02_75420 [Longispora fulva]|uniref:dTDP-4-amino-4,6-dideoxygalactose transaminase n=1 Tax=Longispora fulva TaxID=619741 RepID=A0A8J7GSM9_9ACTN|nr:DegT/DnrJ/EryC1/StrS family aminotransferase [Longispora fulva]MBG6136321.1 dTDP-4-amino-4,6-dideoxygalactose transaminase [Longispora fulva]GIG63170.1 hypothetical protein Lfu02_75420 [Longispora fulva]
MSGSAGLGLEVGGRPRRVTLHFPKAEQYGPAEHEAVARVMASGLLSEIDCGPATRLLEERFAALAGTDLALSFNSGTASLHAAVHAVEVPPGAGVATSPLTWVSAITAIGHAGSFPVFCDVEPGTANISAAAVADNAGRVGAVLATHAYGIPVRLDALARAGLPVIEDCSHAHGAVYRGRPVGSWGAAGCFSLQHAKFVSGGEGGVLTTGTRRIYERAMTLGHHPRRLADELTEPDLLPLAVTGVAYKFRIHPLAAAIAAAQLLSVPQRMADSENNLAVLLEALAGHGAPVTAPVLAEGTVRGWYGTPLWCQPKVTDHLELRRVLKNEGVPLRDLYEDWLTSPVLHNEDLFRAFFPAATGYRPPDPAEFPHYYAARRQMLVLKIPSVPADDYMVQVADAIAAVLATGHHTL